MEYVIEGHVDLRKPLRPQLSQLFEGRDFGTAWAEKAGAGQGYRIYFTVFDKVTPWAKRTYRNRAMRVVWEGNLCGIAFCILVPTISDIGCTIWERGCYIGNTVRPWAE